MTGPCYAHQAMLLFPLRVKLGYEATYSYTKYKWGNQRRERAQFSRSVINKDRNKHQAKLPSLFQSCFHVGSHGEQIHLCFIFCKATQRVPCALPKTSVAVSLLSSRFSPFTFQTPLMHVTETKMKLCTHTCGCFPASVFLGRHFKRFWNWVVLPWLISPWCLLCSSSKAVYINTSLYPLTTSWIRTALVVDHSRKSCRETLWPSRQNHAIFWLVKWVLVLQVMVFTDVPLLALMTIDFSAVL